MAAGPDAAAEGDEAGVHLGSRGHSRCGRRKLGQQHLRVYSYSYNPGGAKSKRVVDQFALTTSLLARIFDLLHG